MSTCTSLRFPLTACARHEEQSTDARMAACHALCWPGRAPAKVLCARLARMADLGYDADFLGATLAPPQPSPQSPSPTPTGSEPPEELDYTHFTVRMHPTRRLAWWVAWNIDGLRLFPSDSISRSGQAFRADPRIPESAQTLNDAYEGNVLDRGHIARRSDLLWGTLARSSSRQHRLVLLHQHHSAAPRTSTSPGVAGRGVCWRTPFSPRKGSRIDASPSLPALCSPTTILSTATSSSCPASTGRWWCIGWKSG